MLPVAAGQLRIGMNSVQAPTQWIRHKTVHPVHLHCTCATSPSERPSWAFWMICLGECLDQRCHTGLLTPNLPPETIQGASTSHCRSCEGFKASSGMRPLQTEQPWWDSNWAVVYRWKEAWHWGIGWHEWCIWKNIYPFSINKYNYLYTVMDASNIYNLEWSW